MADPTETTTETPSNEEAVDRRSTIEAAFEELGKDETTAPAPPPAEAKTTEDTPPKEGEHKEVTSPAPPPDESQVDTTHAIDKPPQSWRAPQRAKWATLDPDIRQEVMRRERETTRVLGESATARQLHQQFQQVVQPYQAHLEARGVGNQPLVAFHELLKADYILSSAPKVQRAQAMAKLINDYGIDIIELDNALAGKQPTDPVDARVEQLLQQRLAPLQQFLTAQQQREWEADQQSSREINAQVEKMGEDPKYPHFEEVRQDMADLVEISAKRGVFLSLDDAYNRAIAMNPVVSKQVATQREAEAKRTSAQAAHARAQKALNASVSVGGSPGGAPSGASGATDRRSVIAAAFDSIGGR